MSQRVLNNFTMVYHFNHHLMTMAANQHRVRQTGKDTINQNLMLAALRECSLAIRDLDVQYYKYLWVDPYAFQQQLIDAGIPSPRIRGEVFQPTSEEGNSYSG